MELPTTPKVQESAVSSFPNSNPTGKTEDEAEDVPIFGESLGEDISELLAKIVLRLLWRDPLQSA